MRETLNLSIALANRYGDAWWNFASLMFIQVTVLVAVLFCLDLVLRRKVRAVVRYWIWLLVLAKLVLPTSVRTPASVAYWLPPSQIASDEMPLQTVDAVKRASDTNQTADVRSIAPLPSPPSPPIPLARVDAKAIVFGVWLTAVGFLLGVVWRRVRTVRCIADEATAAPADLMALLVECLPSVSLKPGRVRLRVTDRLGSPAICGFWTPTILLPRQGLEKLEREQIRLILIHELVHWQRGDLQVNCLQTVLQVFYFYNPAVWIANVMVRRLREQAVDETVLVMARVEAERYASTLLDLAAFAPRPAEPMLRLIGVVESRSALAGRIRRIVGRPIPKTARVGLTGLAAIVAIGLLLVPMARSQRPVEGDLPKGTAARDAAELPTDGVTAVEHDPPRSALFEFEPPQSELSVKRNPVTDAVTTKFLGLGLAMSTYLAAHQRFPAAATHGNDGQPLLSWRVELLPYLGEKELYDQFHHDEPWDSQHNKPLLKKMPELFYNPRVGDLDGKTVFLAPTGEETMFFDDQGTTPEQFTPGDSQSYGMAWTISIVEADAEHAVPWTKPADFPVDKSKPDAGLARDRAGALTVALASGSTWTLPREFDNAMLWGLFTRAGDEKVVLPRGTSGAALGSPLEKDDDSVDRAGGKVGNPADVVAEFKSPKKPLSIEEKAAQTVADKLHQIALALEKEGWSSEENGRFPPAAICDKSGKPLLSWRVNMLRYLDEGDLYDQFHLDEPWDSPHNLPLLRKMPDIYLNPKMGRLGGKTVFLLPAGKETMFFDDKGTRPNEITDGRGKTIMVVVADAEHAVPWTRPEDLVIDQANPAHGLERWSDHYFMTALANAQIALLPDNIEPTTLWGFFTRAGGERLAVPPPAPGQNR